MRALKDGFKIAIATVLLFAMCEGVVALGFAVPQLLAPFPAVLRVFRLAHRSTWRTASMWCTIYDNELTYQLRPGSSCRFRNWGFDTTIDVNSAGFRDDEASLDAPEIVMIGDSHAMGWGQEAGASFASKIEQRTGMKVLNTGTSSYGTMRERRVLDRVDRSRMRYLIVQYCENDDEENAFFRQAGAVRSRQSRARFEHLQAEHIKSAAYFPGKLITSVLGSALKPDPFSATLTREQVEERARLFLHALTSAGAADLANVQLIMIALTTYGRDIFGFPAAVRNLVEAGSYPQYVERMAIVDVAAQLDPAQHYMILDGHLNASGHELVAKLVSQRISELEGVRRNATSAKGG